MNHSYLERLPEEALRFPLALLSPKLLSKVLEGVIGETFFKKFPLKKALYHLHRQALLLGQGGEGRGGSGRVCDDALNV